MKNQYLLLGPDNIFNINKKGYFNVIGDGENKINCKDLPFLDHSNIIISAHGKKPGIIDLCSETMDALNSLNIISDDKSHNFEVFSCHSNSILDGYVEIPKDSTLITSTLSNRAEVSSIHHEFINNLADINIGNAFIKFAHYIFLVPNVVKFAVKKYIFETEDPLSELKDLSHQNINEIRKSQLLKFINWCNSIKNGMNDYITNQIEELVRKFGDIQEIEKLSRKYDVEKYLSTALIEATLHNDNLLAIKIIEAGIDLNIQINTDVEPNINSELKSNDGWTALHAAASGGNEIILNKLIEFGADLNIKDNYGMTALNIAAGQGKKKIIKQLITANARLNIKDNEGHTALHKAVGKGHEEITKCLIDAGAFVNIQDNEGWAVLHLAIQENPMLSKQIIYAGADLNIQNNHGNTPLHIAAYSGNEINVKQLVKQLIDNGEDLYIKNNYGLTAADTAKTKGYTKIWKYISTKNYLYKEKYQNIDFINAAAKNNILLVNEFIKSGIDINIEDNVGNTALHVASLMDNKEIVKQLIESGANLDIKNHDGKTALYIAALMDNEEIVKQLIDKGASLNIKDHDGKTALYIATFKENEEIVKQLIDAEADLNIQDNKGKTALYIATLKGNKEIVKQLIGAKADLNIPSNDGNTALHVASLMDNKEIVKQLIESGADLNIKNHKEKTALDFAELGGCTEIAEYISSYHSHYEDSISIDVTGNTQKDCALEFLEINPYL